GAKDRGVHLELPEWLWNLGRDAERFARAPEPELDGARDDEGDVVARDRVHARTDQPVAKALRKRRSVGARAGSALELFGRDRPRRHEVVEVAVVLVAALRYPGVESRLVGEERFELARLAQRLQVIGEVVVEVAVVGRRVPARARASFAV